MPKSLAELRAERPKSRPERFYKVCLAPHLLAEVGSLTDELAGLESGGGGEERQDVPPKRMGEGEPPRATVIRERLRVLLDEMADHEGDLKLRAVDDGEWRRWANAHPARADGDPGFKRDQQITFGYCNADALIDDLGRYAVAWNGETLDDGDWAILSESVSAPDKKHLAALVVQMHESDISVPKLRQLLSANLPSESA